MHTPNTTIACEPVNTEQCVSLIRSLISKEAFAPAPRKLLYLFLHLGIIAICYYALTINPGWLIGVTSAIIAGNSLTCILFYCHELSHNTIIPRGRWTYPLEVFFFTPISIPATMWRRVHNHSHHGHLNTVNDPDRFFLKSELSEPNAASRRWYTQLFYPHRDNIPWNPLVGFIFVTWVMRHATAALYPGQSKPKIVTYKPPYTPVQRKRIMVEVAIIGLYHVVLFFCLGRSLGAYFWAIPVSYCVGSTIGMAYIWTQHYLHELSDSPDALKSTTSIEVYPLFDKMHTYMSYHVEHHMFPGMNSEYYPEVSKLLKTHFPGSYNRISFREAWRRLWTINHYMEEGEGQQFTK